MANQVGFGGSGTGYTSVSGAIKEYIPGKAALLFNTASKVIASGAVSKVKVDGAEFTCTVVPPCTDDVGWGRDFSRWPSGSAPAPVKMRIPPTHILGVLKLGNAATLAKLNVQDQAQLIETQLTARLKQMTLHLARGIFGGTASPVAAGLGTWSGTAAGSTVTMSFNDVSLFKEGAPVDYLPNVGLSYVVRVQQVVRTQIGTNSANVAGTVTFINDVINPATGAATPLAAATTNILDSFRQRGTTDGFGGSATPNGNVLTGFADITTAATLQGNTASGLPGWAGNTIAVGGSYNQEVVSAFAARVEAQSGEAPTHYFCSPQLLRAHGSSFQVIGSTFGVTGGLNNGSTPKAMTGSADKFGPFGADYTLLGRPIIGDISCPADTMVLHNRDHVMLAEYNPIQALEQSGDSRLVDRDFVSSSYQLDGQYQLVTDMRCAVGTMTGFTGL